MFPPEPEIRLTALEEKLFCGEALSPHEQEQVAKNPALLALSRDMAALLPVVKQPSPAGRAADEMTELAWARWQRGLNHRLHPVRHALRVWLPMAAAFALVLGLWANQKGYFAVLGGEKAQVSLLDETAQGHELAEVLGEEVGLETPESPAQSAGVEKGDEVAEAFSYLEDDDTLMLMSVMGVTEE